MDFESCLNELPLVAILRGIEPEESVGVGAALVEAGFRLIEVPMNSPNPIDSIHRLASRFGDRALIGAGTVMSGAQVGEVVGAGGRLIVMPHTDPALIRAARAARAWCVPGAATPTEGFAALSAGADAIKMFPGEMLPPTAVKAWKAVFPPDAKLLPVGGVTPQTMAPYHAAGAAGFGIGSALYRPGRGVEEVAKRARAFADAWRALGVRSGG